MILKGSAKIISRGVGCRSLDDASRNVDNSKQLHFKTEKESLNTGGNVKFSDAIAKICKVSPDISIPEPECNVSDGDSLRQRIPWTRGEIFRELKSLFYC